MTRSSTAPETAPARQASRLATLPAALWPAAKVFVERDAPRHGAALAFYTVFSLAPLLVVITAGIAVLLGTATVPITGRWRLNLTTTTVTIGASPTVEVRSALGNVRTATVTVQ